MKKNLYLVIFILLANHSYSQAYLGFMGGGSFSEEVEVRGAMSLEWAKNKYLSFRFEPAFTIRGNREVARKIGNSADRSAESLSYFELSALTKFSMPLKIFNPYAVLGVQAGYGLGVKSSYINGTDIFQEKYAFEDLDLDPFDWGVTFGLGLEKEIHKNRKIFADFRYYLGLMNFDAIEGGDIFNAGKVFSIGFLLPIWDHPK